MQICIWIWQVFRFLIFHFPKTEVRTLNIMGKNKGKMRKFCTCFCTNHKQAGSGSLWKQHFRYIGLWDISRRSFSVTVANFLPDADRRMKFFISPEKLWLGGLMNPIFSFPRFISSAWLHFGSHMKLHFCGRWIISSGPVVEFSETDTFLNTTRSSFKVSIVKENTFSSELLWSNDILGT